MHGPVVSSVKDERVAALRSLGSRSGRRAAGRCLLEGRSLIDQAVASGAVLDTVLCAESVPDPDELVGGVTVQRVRDGVLRQIAGAHRPVQWLASAVVPDEAAPSTPWGEFAVVCDGVADPGNLGTLVRSARGLGVDDLVLTDDDTDLTSRRVLDASRGTALTLRTRRYPTPGTAVRALRAAGLQVVATSPRGRRLQALAELDGRPVALVVGGETAGVTAEVEDEADLLVAIPMTGVESLNVGVAAGIGIYELRTKMVLAMIEDRIRGTLGRDVAVTGRFVRAALDRVARETAGLAGDEIVLLMVVAAEGHSSRDDLVRDLAVGADRLAELTSALSERGWLRPDDADGTGYAITEAGTQAVAAFWPVQQQLDEQLLSGLDDTERRTLRELLARVRDNAIALAGAVPDR